MPGITPIKVNFGTDALNAMWRWVEEQIEFHYNRTKNFREEKLKTFSRLYKAKPEFETRDFPWPGASNLELPIIATNSDQLLARVMAIYMTEPLWTAKIFGDLPGGTGDDQKKAIENFLQNMALEPSELNFYPTEEIWFSSAIRNGTAIVKAPWIYSVEQQYVTIGDIEGSDYKYEQREIIKLEGPKPENVPLNKFLTDINYRNLDDSPFKCHIITVNRKYLENKKAFKFFDSADIDKIIASPDRSNMSELQEYNLQMQGIENSAAGVYSDEYDIYECWYKYQHNGTNFSLACLYHKMTKTRLFAFYNPYPENMGIFEDTKLAYDDEQYYGYGFAEMLKAYQDELSEMHRQRVNAKVLANTTAFRVNKTSKLHSIFQFYPGVLVPADEGEIERLDTTNPSADNMSGEEMLLSLITARTGLDPATGGTGGGIVNSKRGIYSSQGTFAVLQQQNTRTALRMSDMRSAHSRLGIKFCKMYAHLGIGKKLGKFGDNAEILKAAFKNIKDGKLGISIRASTASMNKELEKQNDIMLATTLQQLYQGDAQIIQAMSMQGIPDELKLYYLDVLRAKQSLYRQIVQNFGHDDVARLIPVPAMIKQGVRNETNPQPGINSQSQSPGLGNGSGSQGNSGAQDPNSGNVPVGSGESLSGIPVGNV